MHKGIVGAFFLAFGLAIGCGGGGGGSGQTTSGGEDAYAGPIASTDVALGQQRYEARCASCHGGGTGPELQNIGWDPARLRRQIREGSGQMPAISEARLSNDEMEAVLAYLQTIGAVSDAGAQPAAGGTTTTP
jgi:mono/diheme cytochrome c family protein